MSAVSPRTRFVILGLLCTSPMSGYDLKQSIDEAVRGFWQESYGQLYPTLKQLAAEGLVTEADTASGARRRIVYTITDAGRAALSRWLAEPAQAEHTRSELALKVFFGAWAPPGAVRAHLRAAGSRSRAQAEQFAAVARDVAASDPNDPSLRWWQLTLDLGRRVAQARAEWADAALLTLGDTDE